MENERNWREAKMPKWVIDSINKDMRDLQLTAALAWPTEAKPCPVGFRWGYYDIVHGTPEAGIYWVASISGSAVMLEICRTRDVPHDQSVEGIREWAFKIGVDGKWRTEVHRGPLFETECDANLWALWEKCEKFAAELMMARAQVYG